MSKIHACVCMFNINGAARILLFSSPPIVVVTCVLGSNSTRKTPQGKMLIIITLISIQLYVFMHTLCRSQHTMLAIQPQHNSTHSSARRAFDLVSECSNISPIRRSPAGCHNERSVDSGGEQKKCWPLVNAENDNDQVRIAFVFCFF